MFNLRSAHRLAVESKSPTDLMVTYRDHRNHCNTCNIDEVCDTAETILTAIGHEEDRNNERWNPRSW